MTFYMPVLAGIATCVDIN